jgi:hypothetical protein
LVLFHKWMSTSLGDVLRLGVWSAASTYFRFFHAPMVYYTYVWVGGMSPSV